MNAHDLRIATEHMKGQLPDDLKTMLKSNATDLNRLQIFARYMVYLADSTPEKLVALHRMKIIIDQHSKEKFADELLEFVSKEIQHWEYRLKMETEFRSIPVSEIPVEERTNSKELPLKWTGNVTELGTMFFHLQDRRIIDNTKTYLAKWIVEHFLDKSGKPFSLSTIQTLLNKSNDDKRANVSKSFEPESLFSNESEMSP